MQKLVRYFDTLAEADVAVRLRQNGEAIAQPDVVIAKAGAVVECEPTFLRLQLIFEIAVVIRRLAVALLHPLPNFGKKRVALEGDDARVGVRIQRRRIRQLIAVIRTIRRVQIDRDERIPSMQNIRDQSTRLRRLEFHVVAIEIESLSVLAHADAVDRADLRRAMRRRDFLVTVGVVDRRDENRHPPPQLAMRRDEIAQEHLRCFFSFHFAGVNVGHDEDDRLVLPRSDDHERQRAALGRGGEILDANVGIDRLSGVNERDDVVIARRRFVIGCFSEGSQESSRHHAQQHALHPSTLSSAPSTAPRHHPGGADRDRDKSPCACR